MQKQKEKQKMKTDFRKSAGIIVYRVNKGTREYLLLEYGAGGHWDYAKGGIEPDEDERAAALRELREETGLTDVRVVDGFKESLHYFFRERGGLVSKTVVFLLGEVPPQAEAKLSFEHSRFAWLPFEEALQRATYGNAKETLRKAEEFLKTRQRKKL